MADQYLQQLTEETSPVDTDLMPITDSGTQRLRKIPLSGVRSFLLPSSPTQGSVLFVGSGGVIAQDNANLVWDDTNNRLGVGNASPLTQVNIANTNDFASFTDLRGNAAIAGQLIENNLTNVSFANPYCGFDVETKIDFASDPGAKNAHGVRSLIVIPSTNSTALNSGFAANGLVFNSVNKGTGSIGNMRGVVGFAINDSTGSIANAVGFLVGVQNNNASGVITAAYGIQINSIINAGTVTTTYGLHIGDLTTGTQTNTPFSIYSSDPGTFNYFAGNTGINETAPDAMLEVKASSASEECIHVKAAASQTAHLQNWTDSSDAVLLSVSENGYLKIKKTAAPADAELDNNELSIWWDEANSQVAFKGKNNSGTVKTGTLTLT